MILPGDDEYESSRQVHQAAVDARPFAIVRAGNSADVIETVDFARTNDLPLAVRGGGHSPAGYGTVDGGVVVDLSTMKRLDVDPGRRVAWAEPGLTWGEYNRPAPTSTGWRHPVGDVSEPSASPG